MADDESSSTSSKKLDIPNWLGYLAAVGVTGGFAYLAYSHSQQRRRQEELELALLERAHELASLRTTIETESTAIHSGLEATIEQRIDEKLDPQLRSAQAKFDRRIDQISDSAASAVEQILREGTRRIDDTLRKAEEKLDHVGWLDDQVSPSTEESRPQASSSQGSEWSELSDFQQLFKP